MQRLWSYRFRRTTLIFWACLATLGGVGLSIAGYSLISNWYLLSGLVLIGLLKKRSVVTLMVLILVMTGVGWHRGTEFALNKQAYLALYGHKLTLKVTALNDAGYGSLSQFSFDGGQVSLADGHRLVGKLQISGFGTNSVLQGDELMVTGKLMSSRGAYQGRMSYAQMTVIKHQPSIIAEVRRKFSAGMQTALPEPSASFAMGLLIGQRTTLPANIKQDILSVGLTHIIAVSGYNLTIMLGASQRLAGKRSKRLKTYMSFGLMAVFLLMAGASASIVRAAIVSTLSIAAGYYGRRIKPLNLILIAAAITAWANPFYVWGDASWFLSFLAFFGVLVLAPLLVSRVHPAWQNMVLVMVAIESFCAEIMTLPYVLYTFGQMSLVGLPANVMVVALVPLAMLLSVVAGLGGMLSTAGAGWLAWPANIILTYMLDIAHLLSKIPHSFLQKLSLSAGKMIGLYVVVIIVTFSLMAKTKLTNSGNITDRKRIKSKELPA